MSIELKEGENLFGDAVAEAPDIDRDTLARALYAQLRDVTLEDFVAMFTNGFEAVVDYANLCAGEKTGQRISLNFNPHRLDTGTKRFPISLFRALHDEAFVRGLARVVLLNKKKGATKDLLYASVGMGVQGTSYVQEFPPHVARDLAIAYGMSKRCNILDPCAGWGGRMLGFSAVCDAYTCCEPSARTAAGLRRILRFIQSFRADFHARINEAPFEDVELEAASFDFAMTSPPYYDTEHYAPSEKINSMNRYASFNEWCHGFYAPLIHRTMRALKPGACFVLNIGSRIYPLNDKLIEISAGKYEVSKEKDRLSASNGLGKTGEGETFYEVKNPGNWTEPDALPIIVETPHTDVSSYAFTTKFVTSDGADIELPAVTIVESSAATATSTPKHEQSSAADAAADFNPLDAFLTALGPEPVTANPQQSEDADSVSQNSTPVLPTPSVAAVAAPHVFTAHQIQHMMLKAGHQIFAKHGKLIVTNASLLNDDERKLIKSMRDELLVIAPTFPEEQQSKTQTIVQFLGEAPTSEVPKDWRVEAPPSLDGISELELDFETDGVDYYDRDIAIGWAIRLPNGKKKYYPMRHRNCSDQIDPAVGLRWFQTELKNKRITNARTGFEVHTARAMGADLVEQGCTFSDVMHYAALLDDHRKRFALNELAKDFLNREKEGMDLDPTRMADYEPWMVAKRAEGDVETVAQLKEKMWPLLDAQGLQLVRQLEDDIIPVVCEMERNGAPLDVERLQRDAKASEEHYHRLIREVTNEAGFNFDDTDASWMRLFERYKIPLVFGKVKGTNARSDKPTFKDAVLERIDHPVIKKARFAAQLDSLRSKIYKPYLENVDKNGILRVEYNQLRIDDEGGQRGTVSGRFSAPYVQQVPNHDNHFAVFGDLYDPRGLYVPGSGLFFAGDASQIEYRIFASHAKNPRVLQAYRDDPRVSFHKLMWPKITRYRPDFSYTNMKSFNFMRMYGGGTVKTAVMMGMITEEQGDIISANKTQKTSPLLEQAREIESIYDKEMPEVKPLTRRAMHLAMSKCNDYCNKHDDMHKELKHRGYVKTVLGRRSRFPTDYKIHKALNAIIQGSAADIMKTKLVELFKQRKSLGFTMRMTVHDEVTGDVPDVETAKKIEDVLNVQSIAMTVPVLWAAGTGKNWKEAK
jgi:DNA polymerase I-like protein with 3'-5' exonuclease and polymerase domains